VAKRPPRRKVEPGNAAHVGAPMPGTIATVPVHVGQKLAKGEALLTLEAMKMETTVRAERDGAIKQILVKPGLQVDTKDLLIVFE
jgi:pyruvate carboxylase